MKVAEYLLSINIYFKQIRLREKKKYFNMKVQLQGNRQE